MSNNLKNQFAPYLDNVTEEVEYDKLIYDELMINKRKRRKGRRIMTAPQHRKVFVVSRGIHDFSAAEKFGELIYLSDEIQLKLSTPAVIRKFVEILSEESAPWDLLLATGLSFLNIIAMKIFMELHGDCSFLVYNKVLKSYTEHSFKVPSYLIERNSYRVSQRYIEASTGVGDNRRLQDKDIHVLSKEVLL